MNRRSGWHRPERDWRRPACRGCGRAGQIAADAGLQGLRPYARAVMDGRVKVDGAELNYLNLPVEDILPSDKTLPSMIESGRSMLYARLGRSPLTEMARAACAACLKITKPSSAPITRRRKSSPSCRRDPPRGVPGQSMDRAVFIQGVRARPAHRLRRLARDGRAEAMLPGP